MKHNVTNDSINVLDFGYVTLKNKMGEDFTPEETARLSTGKDDNNRTKEDKIKLTRMLLRQFHTSPFESVCVTFEIKAPIFVIREWHRHRTQSYSEESARYKVLDGEYYAPKEERIRLQSSVNKQGTDHLQSELLKRDSPNIIYEIIEEQQKAEDQYQKRLKKGIAREIARINMPVSHYSTFRATANLLNWFRFLQLRLSSYAQEEIQVYAKAIERILTQHYPECMAALKDYWINAKSFSSKEIEILLKHINKEDLLNQLGELDFNPYWTKREMLEFKEKLGL